jgi:peptide/nickel transport system permease protein
VSRGTPTTLAPTRVEVASLASRPVRSYWRHSSVRFLRNRLAAVAAVFLLLQIVIALAAPLVSALITHVGPEQLDLTNIFAPPSGGHWLGTDELGRDTLTRLVWGGRVTLTIAFLSLATSLCLGVGLGLLAGFHGGLADEVIMRTVDIVLSVPSLFLFILMSTLLRPDVTTLAFIIALVTWTGVARLVRGDVLSIRHRDFMLATRSLGAGGFRLMGRHLLPNALPTIIVAGNLLVAEIILIEAALDYLNLGVQLPTPSWGNMLSNAPLYLVHSGWLIMFPGLTILFTVLALNILGNALRDALDPRLM